MREAILIFGNTYANPELFFATQFLVLDDFFFIEVENQSIVLISDLELDRARQLARVDRVLSYSQLGLPRVVQKAKQGADALLLVIVEFLKRMKITKLIIPKDFPAYHAFYLKNHQFQIRIDPSYFKSQREIKTADDVANIRKAQQAAQYAFKRIEQVLSESMGDEEGVYWRKKPLTVPLLQRVIDKALLEKDCTSTFTIISSGLDSASPHFSSKGRIHPDMPLLIDIFPMHRTSRFHGDMTRTYLVGNPSKTIQKNYDRVLQAREIALNMCKPGVACSEIHRTVCEYYNLEGFKTINDIFESKQAFTRGFLHDLGHGIGLKIHEAPFLSYKSKAKLEPGHVITIEPGLYDPEAGGVRVEDALVITETGYEILQPHSISWSLKN